MAAQIRNSPKRIKLNNKNVPDESPYIENTEIAAATGGMISNNDVRFNNGPIEIPEKERKRRLNPDIALQRAREREKHENEIQEQSYKSLMHLLDKSQFYSKFILSKIGKETEAVTTTKIKTQNIVDNENISPNKNTLKNSLRRRKDDKRGISPYVKQELQKQKQKLRKGEIEAPLGDNSDETSIKSETTTEIPKSFNGTLFDYQAEGFHWLKVLYETGLSGILADEMGLGKTIQVIVLICHLLEKRQAGPFLIVVPLSTLPNWMLEFERFAPDVPTIMLYGPEDERRKLYKDIRRPHPFGSSTFKTRPVVITSYEVPMRDWKFLNQENWRYIIVDEAQRIKNHECQLIKVLHNFSSVNRLVLTGTPLQNNLSELWSLLNFLLPEIFDKLTVFKSWFDVTEMQRMEGTRKLLKQEEEKQVISSMREILKPFMLRREKSDVNLPISRKKELVVYAPLTELQYDLYKGILNYDLAMLSRIKKESEIIPDVGGKRQKRRCALYHPYASKKHTYDTEGADSSSIDSFPSTSNDSSEGVNWINKESVQQKTIAALKQYSDVDARNCEYIIRTSGVKRDILYQKVVNHPYLIHYPRASDGLPKIDHELVKASGKLLVLDAMLAKLKQTGHKVLLFSTMTMILDIIEDYLIMRPYKYVRLDGTTDLEDRRKDIKSFNDDPNIFLFLISTKAGGVGLNLVGADTVIIYDSHWNPQVDIQAMARCHRIGQTRPVMIYKLCTKGTIDERIMVRADAKRLLEKAVISKEGRSLNVKSEGTLMELKHLLEAKDYQVVKSENDVFSEEELNKLLDRSDLMD